VEKLLSVNELLTADEAFFSGTYAELAPIKAVGHYAIGAAAPGPVTKEIMELFQRVSRGEEARYASWLAPVPTLTATARRTSRR